MTMNSLPEAGYVRISQILGDKKAIPPVPPIIPVGRTAWWQGIKDGIYPPAVKLSKRTTVWRVSDIRELIDTGVWKPAVDAPLKNGEITDAA